MLSRTVVIVSFGIAALIAAHAPAAPASARDAPSAWWLDVQVKARSVLIDPASGERAAVLEPTPNPMGIVSPDGQRVAYIASDPARVKDGHDFDLFVADVDSTQPAGKANARRLTIDQPRPVQPRWLPDSTGIVFQAGDDRTLQVWYIDLGPDSKPVRLSDGQHRSYDVSVLPDGRVAWIVHKGSRQKAQFKDLLLHPSPATTGHMRTLLADQHISSYAISPDGKTLAWSGLGSMFLVNLETNESREIPLHGIHRQLLNHSVYQFAWRPDGKVIAIQCGFLGGIAREFNGDPNAPWPRMFAADKVFFVPVMGGWTPTAESLKVGEGDEFPSPTADDPKAEVSPAAGDERKPWWVRELPERALSLKWVSEKDANDRIAKYPAPPGQEVDEEPPRPTPPWPGQSAVKPPN